MDGKPTLIGMSREEMVAAMADAGVPEKQRKMRVNQIWHWLYVRGSSDFADMHTISRNCGKPSPRATPWPARKSSRNRFQTMAPASG
jgi:hypothetical protein